MFFVIFFIRDVLFLIKLFKRLDLYNISILKYFWINIKINIKTILKFIY